MGRSAYIGREKNIPEKTEYTRVEFLESTGIQHIDTGVKPNQDTRIVIDFEVLTNTAEAHICSARTNGGTPLLTLYYNASGTFGTRYGTGSSVTFSGVSGKGRYLFDRNKNVCTINGANAITATAETFSVANNLTLFCRNDGTATNAYIKGRLYSCKIYDNDVLVRDYIPVINADNEPCLYDKLNHVYYRNAGSGAFIAGPLGYVGLPGGYVQVDHVESTGEQYFDTGIVPNQDTRVTMAYHAKAKSTSHRVLFGSRAGTSSKAFAVWLSSNGVNPQYGSVAYNTKTYDIDYAKYVVYDINKNEVTIDGTTKTFSAETFSAGHNLFLLAINNGGTIDERMAVGHLYWCKIYQGGVLVRDYVPCVQGGVVGLYDLVNCIFCVPATGELIAGKYNARSVARQWKNILFGINGIARRGRKGWVGVNGVARPFWGDYELVYYGEIEPFSTPRYGTDALSIGDYAAFFGGENWTKTDGTTYTNAVEAYTDELTKVAGEDVSFKYPVFLEVHTIGNVGLVRDGTDIDVYSEDLARTGSVTLPRDLYSGEKAGKYIVFAGDYKSTKSYALDESLTGTDAGNTPATRFNYGRCHTENHAIFAAGKFGTLGSSYANEVFACDEDFLWTQLDNIQAGEDKCGGVVGVYGLIAGGYGKTSGSSGSLSSSKSVWAYDDDLVRYSLEDMEIASASMESVTNKGYCLFTGGHESYDPVAFACVYTEELVKGSVEYPKTPRSEHGSAFVGLYMLVGGGATGIDDLSAEYLTSVEAYKFV